MFHQLKKKAVNDQDSVGSLDTQIKRLKTIRGKSNNNMIEPPAAMNYKMDLQPDQLISYGFEQIDQETIVERVVSGKNKELSLLEKGRIIVKFMGKKNEALKNRHFYNEFFQEQDKAEKIAVLAFISEKVQDFLQQESGALKSLSVGQGRLSLSQYLRKNMDLSDLKLSHQQKIKLL